MKSWEILREAADRVGVKVLASKLNLSNAMVYKWCQETPQEIAHGSGARNPLDRVRELYEITEDERIVSWLCQIANGFFVHNPKVHPGQKEEHLLATTQRVVENFADLLATVSGSFENDKQISQEEATRIRQTWEVLKSAAECFVVACESGLYAQIK